MIGEDLLVAPVVHKGIRKREVILPSGQWLADDGSVYEGSVTIEIEVPLARLPYFKKL